MRPFHDRQTNGNTAPNAKLVSAIRLWDSRFGLWLLQRAAKRSRSPAVSSLKEGANEPGAQLFGLGEQARSSCDRFGGCIWAEGFTGDRFGQKALPATEASIQRPKPRSSSCAPPGSICSFSLLPNAYRGIPGFRTLRLIGSTWAVLRSARGGGRIAALCISFYRQAAAAAYYSIE